MVGAWCNCEKKRRNEIEFVVCDVFSTALGCWVSVCRKIFRLSSSFWPFRKSVLSLWNRHIYLRFWCLWSNLGLECLEWVIRWPEFRSLVLCCTTIRVLCRRIRGGDGGGDGGGFSPPPSSSFDLADQVVPVPAVPDPVEPEVLHPVQDGIQPVSTEFRLDIMTSSDTIEML